jgi:UDP-N-acetylmuramoylalanine--D-glutamate ligase
VSALEALGQITPDTPVVLELSSFQLVGLGEAQLSPAYACVTNLSPDHLNYHGSMEEYARAKQQIFLHQTAQGVLVLHEDLLAPSPEATAQGWQAAADTAPGRCLTMGARPGSQADCHISPEGQVMFGGEPVLHVDEIRLAGAHNRDNVLAAVALARSFGISPASIRAAVQEFGGVVHRLEVVRTLGGVQYVNDTTATNPVAAQAALRSFDASLVLLAGGADKRLALDELAYDIAQRVRVLVLLAGSATAALHEAVRHHDAAGRLTVLGPYDDFAAAIRAARENAAPGEVVLLSPGCASFGMFHNEFHRGDEFRRLVNELETMDGIPG